MKDNWSDPAFAEEWDKVDSQRHPTRGEQLDILTSVIADSYEPGKYILDIGCGSGQVEELILKKNPQTKIVGVDSAAAMLVLAKKRLTAYGDHFQSLQKDIGLLGLADFPQGTYQTVFSVQVLHELNSELRRDLFKKMYDLLEASGQFLIMDRIKTDLDTFERPYKSVWNRLESTTSLKSASDFDGYKQRIKGKEDSPGSVEEYQQLFKEAGFDFAILHLHFDRAVLAGIKK
jgi:ubiquinone/menaquinone biosynthesis C-methylase UbiE